MSDYTVLVLGAGASLPYGLPLGKGLVEKICGILPRDPTIIMQTDTQRLHEIFASDTKIRDSWYATSRKDTIYALTGLRQRLIESEPKSIDEFLAKDFGGASEPFKFIGKLSIAYVIANFESLTKIDAESSDLPEDHWYRYLWQDCLNLNCKTLEDLKQKKLRIISFNYDRSLEYFLSVKVAATYMSPPGIQLENSKKQKWAEIAFKEIESILQITHPYGTLGSLPTIPYGNKNNFRDYGIQMANNIKVINEDRSDIESFSKAREWLQSAKKVVFLGFSYDQTNMERLGLANGLPRAIDMRKDNPFRSVNPMTYGLQRAERNTLINKYFSDFIGREGVAAVQEQDYHQSAPITHYLRSHGGLTEL